MRATRATAVPAIPPATDGLATVLWDVDSLHPAYLGIPAEELLAAVTEHLWDEQNVRVGRTVAYLATERAYGPVVEDIDRLRIKTRMTPSRRDEKYLGEDLRGLLKAPHLQTVVLLSSGVGFEDALRDLARAKHFVFVVHNDGMLHAASNRVPRHTEFPGGGVIHLAKDIPRLAAIRDDFPVAVLSLDRNVCEHHSAHDFVPTAGRARIINDRALANRLCFKGKNCTARANCDFLHRTSEAPLLAIPTPGHLPGGAFVRVSGDAWVYAYTLYPNRAWQRLRDDPTIELQWCPDDGSNCADPDACEHAHRVALVDEVHVPRCALMPTSVVLRAVVFEGTWCKQEEPHDPNSCIGAHRSSRRGTSG